MKKMPICKICAISGVLCGACTDNVETGKITSLDIEYAKEVKCHLGWPSQRWEKRDF